MDTKELEAVATIFLRAQEIQAAAIKEVLATQAAMQAAMLSHMERTQLVNGTPLAVVAQQAATERERSKAEVELQRERMKLESQPFSEDDMENDETFDAFEQKRRDLTQG